MNAKMARGEMKSNHSRRFRVTRIFLGAAIVFALMLARNAKAGDEHQSLVTDWSHRHLIYSEPRSQMKRSQLWAETRYVQHVRRKNAEKRGIGRDEWRWHHAPEHPNQLQGDWSMDLGAGATVGAGNYPAKFSFNTTSANCAATPPPDFVVYNTGLTGSSSQATIVAFDNLYTSCAGGTPQTYWAYNTGLGGKVVTSPVLSFDGSQVAFVETTGSTATLVILRWKAGTGTLAAPVTPTTGACTALTAPCQTTITFSTVNGDTTPTDSFSSPFYVYGSDALFVGDDMGFLHKFTGVFLGTPTETVSAGFWPASLTIGVAGDSGHLNSPVYVDGVNEVLVTGNDGLLFAVDATVGGVSSGGGANALDPKLASPGFEDGPIVDVTTGKVYLFTRASSEFITPSDPPFHGTPGIPSIFEVDIPANPFAIHSEPYIQAIISDNFNAGTATISTVPVANDTITVGPTWSGGPAPTTYKFVTTLASANDVLIVAGSTANTAQNLQAAINANSGQCFASPCFGTGTIANTGATAGAAGSVVTVTATTVGGSGVAFAITSGGRITLSSSTGTLAPPFPSAMYNGAFDDLYNGSANGTGFLYACGTHTVGANTFNAIWYTAIDAGVIDTATVLGPTITTAISSCSPITEFNNGSNDRIFLSVTGNPVTAAPINCTAGTGCIMSFRVDSLLTGASGTSATAPEAGGTSGIVVDNSSAAGGASQVYFTPLADQPCAGSGGVGTGTGGCAIQASQSGLN